MKKPSAILSLLVRDKEYLRRKTRVKLREPELYSEDKMEEIYRGLRRLRKGSQSCLVGN